MEQKISFDLPVDKPSSSSNAFFDDYMEHGNDLTYLDREIDDPKNISEGIEEHKRIEKTASPGFSGFHEFIRSPPRDKKTTSEDESRKPLSSTTINGKKMKRRERWRAVKDLPT